LVAARDEGLVRFIGVTGHGTRIAHMHLASLERFPFDSVLLPYNYAMMQNARYAADFAALERVCPERTVAMQTIKGITLRPWVERPATASTWYEPMTEQGDIDMAVGYVLARPGAFLNTAGDITLLPKLLDAVERSAPAPSEQAMSDLAQRLGVAPLFV
jgi:hypothetical protein